jgi:hypothetical protein
MARDVTTSDEKPAVNHVGPEQTHPVRRESEKQRGLHVPFAHKDQHDPEWDGSDVDFSHINTKKVLRKMDIRLIPNLALLYLLSFLDRGNIGNAKIQGLTEDLKLTGTQYNWCLTVFFFTYCKSSNGKEVVKMSHWSCTKKIRCVRTAKQSPSQTPSSFCLATHHHGSLGGSHDFDGYCQQFCRPLIHSSISWSS